MIDPEGLSKLLCRAKPYKLVPLGQGQVLIYLPEEDRSVLAPQRVAVLLPFCNSYRTIEQHVNKIGRSVGVSSERLPSISDALSALINAATIQEGHDSSVFPAVTSVENRAVASISTIGVLTAERPDHMLRCVESLMQNICERGHSTELIVMDDSRKADYADHLHSLRAYARKYAVNIRYANRQQRAEFCEVLKKSGFPLDVCQHALLGFPDMPCSIGATRNALLIDAGSHPSMMLDGDMVCQLLLHPEHRTGCRFVGHFDPVDTWTLQNFSSLNSDLCDRRRDLIAEHEFLLGKSLRDLSPGDEAFLGQCVNNDVCDHMLTALKRGNGRVILTMAGVAGDPGTYSNIHLLTCRGETRARLIKSQDAYCSTLNSRNLLRVAPCATVTHDPACMAGNIAFSNTTVLPPFIPNFRGEDRIFGALLMKSVTDGYYGYVPVALLHGTDSKREPRSILDSCTVRMTDVYFAALETLTLPDCVQDPSARLRLVGEHLKYCGTLSPNRFVSYIRAALLNVWSARLAYIQNVIEEHGDWPDFWLEDFGKVRRKLIEAMTAKDFWIPNELVNQSYARDAGHFLQRAMYLFGRVCEEWPDIIRVSHECAEKGTRMTTDICS